MRATRTRKPTSKNLSAWRLLVEHQQQYSERSQDRNVSLRRGSYQVVLTATVRPRRDEWFARAYNGRWFTFGFVFGRADKVWNMLHRDRFGHGILARAWVDLATRHTPAAFNDARELAMRKPSRHRVLNAICTQLESIGRYVRAATLRATLAVL